PNCPPDNCEPNCPPNCPPCPPPCPPCPPPCPPCPPPCPPCPPPCLPDDNTNVTNGHVYHLLNANRISSSSDRVWSKRNVAVRFKRGVILSKLNLTKPT